MIKHTFTITAIFSLAVLFTACDQKTEVNTAEETHIKNADSLDNELEESIQTLESKTEDLDKSVEDLNEDNI